MIRCPNCGSTAQVEVCDHYNSRADNPKTDFICGCGCHFEVTYQVKSVEILHHYEPEE